MATCQRGWLMVRNMKTGDTSPFFIKVREEDIVWKDGTQTTSMYSTTSSNDVVNQNVDGDWLIETHTLLNRIYASARVNISGFTYSSERIATTTITLPFNINTTSSMVQINKESGDSTILQNSLIEAKLTNEDTSDLSNTLTVTLINLFNEFDSTVSSLSLYANILIIGFTE